MPIARCFDFVDWEAEAEMVWHGVDDRPDSSGDRPRGVRARDGDREGGADGRASIARVELRLLCDGNKQTRQAN